MEISSNNQRLWHRYIIVSGIWNTGTVYKIISFQGLSRWAHQGDYQRDPVVRSDYATIVALPPEVSWVGAEVEVVGSCGSYADICFEKNVYMWNIPTYIVYECIWYVSWVVICIECTIVCYYMSYFFKSEYVLQRGSLILQEFSWSCKKFRSGKQITTSWMWTTSFGP